MFNFRDLGGVETADGPVRPGRLLRSNALVQLGDEGLDRLADLGVRTAIDLREPGERAAEPSDLAGSGIELHEIALIDAAPGAITMDLLELNRVLLRHRGDRLVAIFRVLAAREALPAVYFCSSGKDRTGLVSGMVLSVLGANDETIAEDYALSEQRLPVSYRERAAARAIAGGMPEEMLEDYYAFGLASPAPVMTRTLELLRAEYGGPTEYLIEQGLSRDELAALQYALIRA